jgi:hypothetical protein
MGAVWSEECISGLPFNALRQGVRIPGPAGSATCTFRHRSATEDAGKSEEPNHSDANLYIGQEQQYVNWFAGFLTREGFLQ